jgi:hypothetical protein
MVKDFLAISKLMRDNAGYNRKTRQQVIPDNMWSSWCFQLRVLEKELMESKNDQR